MFLLGLCFFLWGGFYRVFEGSCSVFFFCSQALRRELKAQKEGARRKVFN